jgi:predicted  nucleic acid-binding Zn ribbon protein
VTKAVTDALFTLVATHRDLGQVLPEDVNLVRTRGGVTATVTIPERKSLSPGLGGERVREQLAQLGRLGIGSPRVQILGWVVESATVCRCRAPRSYVLFTHFLSIEPPVRCGDCWGTVPLYRLPLPAVTAPMRADYRDVLCWQDLYRHCDSLYMQSGVGEQFGQRQMEDADSALSKNGRGVAESLEGRVKRPVYYFLNRTTETTSERRRRCPSCGGPWLLKKPLHGIVDFRCRRCRLVSNVAWGMR